MPYDKAVVERVRHTLAARGDVVEKRMIGGLCFMVGGAMCCGVIGDALMARVGAEARAWALAQPYTRPMTFGGRTLAAFVCIAPEGYQTEAALTAWVQRGLDFAATLPARQSPDV